MLTVDEVEAGIKVESDPLLSDTQQACIKRSCFFRHDIFSLDLDALRTHNQIWQGHDYCSFTPLNSISVFERMCDEL